MSHHLVGRVVYSISMADTTPVLPDDREPTNYGFISGHSETELAYYRWEHPNPKGRVVIAHGYGEHSERYRHIAHWLHERGWSVSAMDHRGFGRSGGNRGDADSIHGFVDDLVLFLRHERRFDANRVEAKPRVVEGVPLPPLPVCPQILLGHSFGGLLSALVLLWHADTVDGLILSSPAIQLRPLKFHHKILKHLLLMLAPHKSLSVPGNKNDVCSDPILVQRFWADPLCHQNLSAAFLQAMDTGREELVNLGHELDRPILLLEAEDDTLVDIAASENFWQSLRSGILEKHLLHGFKHEVLHDIKRLDALRIIETWLWRFEEQPQEPRPLSEQE